MTFIQIGPDRSKIQKFKTRTNDVVQGKINTSLVSQQSPFIPTSL